jgi:membrane protein YqaA with SNARE-associated domain
MDPVSAGGLHLGTFAYCAMSGFVPFMNTEIFLLYVGSTASPADLPGLVVVSALGQMSTKSLLYCAGRGALKLPGGRYRDRIDALRARLSGGGRRVDALTFVSALTGLPSFYAISIVAGALRWPFVSFVLHGTAGRLLRFWAVLFLPGLLKGATS